MTALLVIVILVLLLLVLFVLVIVTGSDQPYEGGQVEPNKSVQPPTRPRE